MIFEQYSPTYARFRGFIVDVNDIRYWLAQHDGKHNAWLAVNNLAIYLRESWQKPVARELVHHILGCLRMLAANGFPVPAYAYEVIMPADLDAAIAECNIQRAKEASGEQ